ncbi:MAG: tRNA (adenosine(37)-N6)-threonylcarbamoyltransferase complex transferase subunit TsaD [Candidatus Woykebacteria bacterium RBG_13_40_15]|uniref:tRNA N6-adenosine threonylcarbamoyltransferase n=1 Tax=Candidatus Woykebacteria bacterium RBG_13_40_15 TaxID=1802593 RepID=A0A1G1W9S9_9BACT|nr:MAG: tRNA (adenosine(37)-N6)-threonylcarbamoyltransferase complex transferase subunit TsaD [Candidatus Woykebacteria bacterium RBG_13_40_15]
MKILGVETSCDETAVAIVENGTKVISSSLASSLPLHAKSGGIIPEIAAREQTKTIIPVVTEVLGEPPSKQIDAIAVTFGPGLHGSLIVGVEVAKTLSYVWKKPLIPVSHLISHIYATWIENTTPPKFPLIALIVSGGHTELVYMQGHGNYKSLGGTRDDAAGESLDKIARLLRLGYPGGPAIEKAAIQGDSQKFNLPRPLLNSPDYDFSFSGLKTAVTSLVSNIGEENLSDNINNIAASVQAAVVEVLITKAKKASASLPAESIVFGGGVAANKLLREEAGKSLSIPVFFPPINLSVDNGVMVAAAAYFNYKIVPWSKLEPDPSILL